MFGLYFDENYQRAIVLSLLRRDGVDCLTSNEAGNGELADPDQLAFATAEGRAIVTLDKGDFQAIHTRWMTQNQSHAGIVIVTSVRVPDASVHAALMRLHAERDAAQMVNAILFIGPNPPED